MSSTVATISEVILLLMQVYVSAQQQAGKTEEEAKTEFLSLVIEFMAKSAKPVADIKP